MSYSSKANEADWKYPLPAESRAQGFLAVGHGHHVYWHEYGNPQGECVLFLHGGPGGGTSPAIARYFNPERYRIVAFDQRGCGKSSPNIMGDVNAALEHNTTGDLIDDIEQLRYHLRITGKMHVFGGSWGSTLSLAYAIANPQHVRTLILRGIFLCRKIDIDYFYQGNAARYHKDPLEASVPGSYLTYPEAWKKFVEVIPPKDRRDMVKAYAKIFAENPKTAAQRKKQDAAVMAWSIWEGSTSFLAPGDFNVGDFATPEFGRALARIENHYFMNGAFLSGKGQAARDNNYLLKNVKKIAHIPAYVVQGQFDEVCPRFQADALVAALKKHKAKVKYIVTAAGHAALERETMRALTGIMDTLPRAKG